MLLKIKASNTRLNPLFTFLIYQINNIQEKLICQGMRYMITIINENF